MKTSISSYIGIALRVRSTDPPLGHLHVLAAIVNTGGLAASSAVGSARSARVLHATGDPPPDDRSGLTPLIGTGPWKRRVNAARPQKYASIASRLPAPTYLPTYLPTYTESARTYVQLGLVHRHFIHSRLAPLRPLRHIVIPTRRLQLAARNVLNYALTWE
uniref:Uncharacterized protein n=1 Tax=Trichogramma kaykai TaxID=54128 RepID=A0ABD2WS73_9HYME